MSPAKLKPRLIVIAGPNGSGKTSLTEKVLQHQWLQGCLYINPDKIAQERFGDWNSASAITQAAQYSQTLRESCLHNQKSLAFESVLSAPDKVDYIRRAVDAGFFVRVFFVGTDHPAINAARITQRVLEGGHDVPIPKIISRYAKSIANASILSELAHRLYVYDNSPEDKTPRLLFKVSEGKVSKVYSQVSEWAQSIADIPLQKQ